VDTKAKTITISSGKGGVGKTCTSVNLAILLAQQGYKVCLFDADANLANVNIMLKLAPKYTLHHVISGQKSLNDITLHKAGIHIIPGASGLTDFMSLTAEQQQRLLKTMHNLKNKYDYLLIDNPAGINENVLSYINYSDYGIIVISPEPTSLTDAFALIRVLQKRGNKKILNVIVNNAPHEEYAFKIFKRFLAAVEKHIGCQLNYLGGIVSDEKIATSVCLQNPVVLQFPTARSARNYNKLSIKLTSLQEQSPLKKSEPYVQKNSPQQPDFSTSAASLHKDREIKESNVESRSIDKLKAELINNIENKQSEQPKLKEIIEQINNAYLKRFGDYVVDLPQVLQDAIKMDRISKTTMQNLIMTLHGLYQDQYSASFEVQNTTPLDSKENKLKQETAELLIKLLQQENDKTIEQKGPKLVPPVDFNRKTNQELLDSIRYASMVDK
jgi:MinD-like ATPase involved in chromosome partitioning or flagellar assembly